jgi:hypothetical protein
MREKEKATFQSSVLAASSIASLAVKGLPDKYSFEKSLC